MNRFDESQRDKLDHGWKLWASRNHSSAGLNQIITNFKKNLYLLLYFCHPYLNVF